MFSDTLMTYFVLALTSAVCASVYSAMGGRSRNIFLFWLMRFFSFAFVVAGILEAAGQTMGL